MTDDLIDLARAVCFLEFLHDLLAPLYYFVLVAHFLLSFETVQS